MSAEYLRETAAEHSAEKDAARIVSRDLSPAAADLAQREGWAAHARMHPATDAEYEARVMAPAEGGQADA